MGSLPLLAIDFNQKDFQNLSCLTPGPWKDLAFFLIVEHCSGQCCWRKWKGCCDHNACTCWGNKETILFIWKHKSVGYLPSLLSYLTCFQDKNNCREEKKTFLNIILSCHICEIIVRESVNQILRNSIEFWKFKYSDASDPDSSLYISTVVETITRLAVYSRSIYIQAVII